MSEHSDTSRDKTETSINEALRQFEATEANLEKLDRISEEIRKMTPEGVCFGRDPKYEDRVRAYNDVLQALPKIDGWKPERAPIDLDDLAQSRLDAREIGEVSAEIAVEQELEAPERELAEYRHRMNKKRRQLIRGKMLELIAKVDEILHGLKTGASETTVADENVDDPSWERLKTCVRAVEMLLGSGLPRPPRWGDLRRHLSFGAVQDLRDIIRLDWPEVKSGLSQNLYGHDEPIPVDVPDLGTLAVAQPKGSVVTKLKWESLSDEDFERLMFSLISSTRSYENPEWLMRTKAPDRGRDLSATRITNDPLSGVIRSRVLIQCKHWLSDSVSLPDVTSLKDQMALWEPPRVDVLIIATTGRFTGDAVSWVCAAARHWSWLSGNRLTCSRCNYIMQSSIEG